MAQYTLWLFQPNPSTTMIYVYDSVCNCTVLCFVMTALNYDIIDIHEILHKHSWPHARAVGQFV